MSLAHKNDNGSRYAGRLNALNRLDEGLDDPQLTDHINEMVKDTLKSPGIPTPIRGKQGYYIVNGLHNVKTIIGYLRDLTKLGPTKVEILTIINNSHFADLQQIINHLNSLKQNGASKVNSVLHRVFFELPVMWNKTIKSYTGLRRSAHLWIN
jgi:hypothetical protein